MGVCELKNHTTNQPLDARLESVQAALAVHVDWIRLA